MFYWNELLGTPATLLAGDLGASDTILTLTVEGPAQVGSRVQIDGEILTVSAVTNNGTQYGIARGVDGSAPATHEAPTPVYQLASQTTIVPFPDGFFGSPYSGSWTIRSPCRTFGWQRGIVRDESVG